MKVILLGDVRKVGKKYDVKEVADGYALNFLIPKKLAEVATPHAVKRVETKKAELDRERKVQDELLEKNLESLKDVKVEITAPVNDKGHLFKGIHKEEIAKAIESKNRVTISPEFIDLDKPIKEVGDHKIDVKVGDKKTTILISIKAE